MKIHTPHGMNPVLFIGAAVTAYLIAATLIKSARASSSSGITGGTVYASTPGGSLQAAKNLAATGGYYVDVN